MNERSEKLMSDVKTLASDAGGVLRTGAADAGDKLMKLEAAAMEKARAAADKARFAAKATDDYVHVYPWTAIGVSAGIGLVLGLLIGRR